MTTTTTSPTKCLTEKELVAMADGGLAPNRAEGLVSHLESCKPCRDALAEIQTFVSDLAAPIEGFDDEAHVRSVMKRLDEPRSDRLGRASFRARLFGSLSIVALAAGVVLFVSNQRHERTTDPAFVARGAPSPSSLDRDVGITLATGTKDLVPLTNGATIGEGAPLTGSYTNIHPRAAWLLVFAVDASGAVHWLYPAWIDEREDPTSIPLEKADRPRVLQTSVVLEAPAKGPLRLVSVVTEAPLHVSDIERRPASELGVQALRRAFPSASVRELNVENH